MQNTFQLISFHSLLIAGQWDSIIVLVRNLGLWKINWLVKVSTVRKWQKHDSKPGAWVWIPKLQFWNNIIYSSSKVERWVQCGNGQANSGYTSKIYLCLMELTIEINMFYFSSFILSKKLWMHTVQMTCQRSHSQ